MLGSKFTKFLSFLKQQISFSSNFTSMFRVMRHDCILSTKGVYQSTNLVKFYVSSWKSEVLHFDGLLLSKSCTFSAKKVQKSYQLSLMTLKSDANLKKPWPCGFKNWREELGELSKIWKFVLWWALFVQSVMLQLENFRGIMCHVTCSLVCLHIDPR